MFSLLQSTECRPQHVLRISSTSLISLRQTTFDGCTPNTGKHMAPCMLLFRSSKTNAKTKYAYIQNWMVACISSVISGHSIRYYRTRVVTLLYFGRTQTQNYCVSVSFYNIFVVWQNIIQSNHGSRTPRIMNNSIYEQIFEHKTSRMTYCVSSYEHASRQRRGVISWEYQRRQYL
jgi:hypothetical protein